MAWLDDLVSLLSPGVAVYGTSLFVSSRAVIPTGDGPYLALIETGGSGPRRTQNAVATPAYVQPGAQVIAFASTEPAAKTMITNAYNVLVGVSNRLVGSVWYLWIRPLQEPFDMGLDEAGRIRIGFNVIALKRPT